MGPIILASGYLSKRTRAMARWKKRWWQLTNDGKLLYFKSEERTKVLCEIDVARSCYDVKLGAERCSVEFPRVVPSCCCFSFSVLKRTYYLYAATAAGAKRWAESIENVSVVLNYRRKGSHRPAPGPPQRPQSCALVNEAVRVPDQENGKRRYATLGHTRATVPQAPVARPTRTPATSDSEAADQATELPRIRRGTQGRYTLAGAGSKFGSVPDLHRGQTHANPHHRLSWSSTNPRLWLDGSPPPDLRVGRRRKTAGRETSGLHTFSASQPLSSSYSGSLNMMHLSQPVMESGRRSRATGQLQGKPREVRVRRQVDREGYDLPPRAQSIDISTLPEKRARFSSVQPQQIGGIPILPFLSQDGSHRDSVSSVGLKKSKSVAPPVKPKPILKKSRPVQTRESIESDTAASSSVTSPTEPRPPQSALPHTTSSSSGDAPAIPPKRRSLRVSVDSKSGQRDVFLPPPPNFKPPPPPEQQSGSSSPVSGTVSESKVYDPPSPRSQQPQPPTSPPFGNNSHHHRVQDNSWEYLRLVCMYVCNRHIYLIVWPVVGAPFREPVVPLFSAWRDSSY